jgi:hypothetical protein
MGCERGSDGQCHSRCDSAATEADCEQPDCVWDGSSCSSPCGSINEASECKYPLCAWIVCDGKPKACSEYGGDACPHALGCDRDPDPAF